MGAYWAEMMTNPAKIWEQQVDYWGKTLQHAIEAQQALLDGDDSSVPDDPSPERPPVLQPAVADASLFQLPQATILHRRRGDARRRSTTSTASTSTTRQRMRYFTQQIIDMMAPTNFLATNPDALEKAIETEGQSLVDGLENMIRDLEAHDGELIVTLADPDAFKVGENLGTTEGSVVYRNRMFELIQYAPTTEKVHATPLIIFPPWINKFYILDLKPENSLIRWIVDQGFTLFVVSWVNPDASYADVGMDDYVEEGFLTAIDEVKKITGAGQGQRGRLLHRRHHAGAHPGADEQARRRQRELRHLLHRAHRFLRPGRGRGVSRRRFRRRDRGRGGRNRA